MATAVLMPKLGLTMEKGQVLKWHKAEGDRVEKGEALFEIETDKIVNQVDSPQTGTVLRVLVNEGEEVPVRTIVAFIGAPGETLPAETPSAPSEEDRAEPAPRVLGARERSGPRITPRARKLMSEHGLAPEDFAGLNKSRIVEDDVRRALASRDGAEAGPAETARSGRRLPLSPAQKGVAASMLRSAQEIPQYSLRFRATMDHCLSLFSDRFSVNPIILRATALALARHPGVQRRFETDHLYEPALVDLGVAVAHGEELFVPVIRDAGNKSIEEIAQEAAALVQKVREGRLLPDDLSGATFTVSNLGMFGITSMTPIVVPGQSGILGVGAVEEVALAREGTVTAGRAVELTLVCDHRAVNGTVGAAFSRELKSILEGEPASSW
jgi:pyruvate dehydrogenase E2 component (dihydrolipoamide acetyltransferase)